MNVPLPLIPYLRVLRDRFSLTAGTSGERVSPRLCKFLQSRAEVMECTRFLERNHYRPHYQEPKNFDLAMILPEIGPGNFLDMGSSDSHVLRNVMRKRLAGECYGIDLRPPVIPVLGVKYSVGDLMDTRLPSGLFRNVTCLSVIEHQVDHTRLCQEAARLLEPAGKLFVSFDFWEPKKISTTRLYDLQWQPLGREDVEHLVGEAAKQGLHLVQELDWELNEPVISADYFGPDPKISYTFGLVVFEKR